MSFLQIQQMNHGLAGHGAGYHRYRPSPGMKIGQQNRTMLMQARLIT